MHREDVPSFSRRQILALAAASGYSLRGFASDSAAIPNVGRPPDRIQLQTEAETIGLDRHSGGAWSTQDVLAITQISAPGHLKVSVRSERTPLMRLRLRWTGRVASNLSFLGDQWERSYGDLSWRPMDPERVMPWYFLAAGVHQTAACGVMTGSAALCYWQIDPAGVTLCLDLRNGGRGVLLQGRELIAANVIGSVYSDVTPNAAARRFCAAMSPSARLPVSPIYGGNNWYYAYGKSSAEDIRNDSERIASWAPSGGNRPFMVIDDGWQPNPDAGPWTAGNVRFPDMADLASSMRRTGVRPGLWIRPLFTAQTVPEPWHLQSPNARKETLEHKAVTLDPTVPEALASIQQDVRTAVAWGYELVKHDFSSYDLLGRWGFAMDAAVTDDDWSFADRSRTNAEIIRFLYSALRAAAGSALLIGCNTIGHLAAGLFEMQRTGDDTSGRDWNRTRKMGVNTLAFRAPQHNTFFAIDADCVGITKRISWKLNRQWLDLLSRSGTPLFVSAAPDAVGSEQNAALREAFALAASAQPTAEAVDWMQTTEPEHWRLQGRDVSYDWFSL